MLCASALPLRVGGLRLVLERKAKQEMMMVYLGDLVWSMFGFLHAFGGSETKIPSYSDMYHEIIKGQKPAETTEAVKQSVQRTLQRFNKE